MKRTIVILIAAAFIFPNCKSTSNTTGSTSSGGTGSSSASQRTNKSDGGNGSTAPDSVIVTGTQYIPLYGKSEAGVRPELEGTWVLESMEGYKPKGNVEKKLDSIAAAKVTIETRNDSVTRTSTKNGVSRSTTEINIDRMSPEQARITPPQGSNYHIPERPSIRFFGSNETFSGFTGCNKFSGRYVQQDSTSLNLQSGNPSTKMVCIGDWDEPKFLSLLQRVNKFRGDESTLELMDGNNVILSFKRKAD